jgi:hypothetical protein
MSNESDMHRRKFMEIGIYTISGTIAALSAVVLARNISADSHCMPAHRAFFYDP